MEYRLMIVEIGSPNVVSHFYDNGKELDDAKWALYETRGQEYLMRIIGETHTSEYSVVFMLKEKKER